MTTRKLTIVTLIGTMLACPAWAGDWGFSFRYDSGRYYCGDYGATYVYYDRSPVIYYRDYTPDIVVYEPPPVVVYERPAVVYRSCAPRTTVVYSDCGPRRYYVSHPVYYRPPTVRTYWASDRCRPSDSRFHVRFRYRD